MDIFEAKQPETATGRETGRPAQMVSMSISVFGFRAWADGETGRKALRRIRLTAPWLAWGAAAYAAVLAVAVVAFAAIVWPP
ncbi:hypothetical protein [Streptomyces sp. NRRL B-24572]|uniref:hypothetical protein n=1 Tax=Streptomyces sp. NRRL B-24572 TaxID=1962156 RepID=UPI000A3A61F0|nr:hypothetical protein [Streptomyces sp. NRRL B-24572]